MHDTDKILLFVGYSADGRFALDTGERGDPHSDVFRTNYKTGESNKIARAGAQTILYIAPILVAQHSNIVAPQPNVRQAA